MTITIICDVLGEKNNGTSIAAFNLIDSMKKRGHTVRVVCPDDDKSGLEGFYIARKYDFGIFNSYIAHNGVSLAKADEDLIREAMTGADVVHILVPFSLGMCAVRLAREMGIPITASFHCQAENITSHIFLKDFTPANRTAYKIFRRHVYQYCDCVHYPSRFICDTFEKCTGKTNHYIISNGVSGDFIRRETEKPEEYRGKFVILFIGRYSREKCHSILIDGVARSAHKDDIRLIFAGTGPLDGQIRELASKKLDHMPLMKFFGREELVDVINFSDLYVHPAEIEIEAIACLEAISCGKVPLICNSKRSATRHFALSDKNLFRCNDSRDLARRIDYWIEHPEAKAECEQRYLGYSAEFDYEKCMDRMEQMLKDAATMKHGKHGKDEKR